MKFGFYHNNYQIQIYNQKDDRIDSIETGLPVELLHKLIGEMKSEAKDKNFNYLRPSSDLTLYCVKQKNINAHVDQ